jgi:D-sedoheptulose 7-phosphate isomerase
MPTTGNGLIDRDGALRHVAAGLRDGAALRERGAIDWAPSIVEAAATIAHSLSEGGKVLLCGNGGSAADAQHLAAEFVGRFVLERTPLPAIALTTDTSVLTAIGNDFGFDQVFSRQVKAHGRAGDVLIAISTSGNSPNVVQAVCLAESMSLHTVAFSGRDGGALAKAARLAIVVPSSNTARIQECHIAIGHVLCELVESALFKAPDPAATPMPERTAFSA